jgi:hypothetical protein
MNDLPSSFSKVISAKTPSLYATTLQRILIAIDVLHLTRYSNVSNILTSAQPASTVPGIEVCSIAMSATILRRRTVTDSTSMMAAVCTAG